MLNRDSFSRLVTAVLSAATHRHSTLHGEPHWRAVSFTALSLAPRVPGADPLVGLLFGLLHDCKRIDDGHDPQHGPRAAVFTRQLAQQGILALDDDRLRILINAIDRHTTARTSDHPTTGLCWDADRLNLWRIGVQPHADYLSTTPARDSATIAAHRDLPGQHLLWTELHDMLDRSTANGRTEARVPRSRDAGV